MRHEIESSCVENENKNRRRKRSGKDKDVERNFKKWFSQVRDKNVPVNGHMLKMKAEGLAQKLGKTDFRAIDGQLIRWLHWENIVYRKRHGEQAEADTKRYTLFFQNFFQIEILNKNINFNKLMDVAFT